MNAYLSSIHDDHHNCHLLVLLLYCMYHINSHNLSFIFTQQRLYHHYLHMHIYLSYLDNDNDDNSDDNDNDDDSDDNDNDDDSDDNDNDDDSDDYFLNYSL